MNMKGPGVFWPRPAAVHRPPGYVRKWNLFQTLFVFFLERCYECSSYPCVSRILIYLFLSLSFLKLVFNSKLVVHCTRVISYKQPVFISFRPGRFLHSKTVSNTQVDRYCEQCFWISHFQSLSELYLLTGEPLFCWLKSQSCQIILCTVNEAVYYFRLGFRQVLKCSSKGLALI